MRNLLFGLMTFITFSVFGTPTTYIVTKGITTNVTCNIGDTLKFYGNSPTGYGVSINSTPVISVHPCMTSPYYIGYYVVVSGDNTFTINSSVNWSGTITVNTTTGITENTNSPTIEVFPNPVLDVLKITTTKKTKVDVYSSEGKLVMTKFIEQGTSDIDFTTLSNGLYFISVDNKTKRVIKNN